LISHLISEAVTPKQQQRLTAYGSRTPFGECALSLSKRAFDSAMAHDVSFGATSAR
jgi:hypothetical protein